MLRTKKMTSRSLYSQLRRVKCVGLDGVIVGGPNPADPRGLPTLISTWSALRYLEQNRQAPHYTNESTSVEILSLQTACLFLSSKLIVNHLLFNCGGGSLLFSLQRKASQGLPQC